MEAARNFTDLRVWQNAHGLVLEVYKMTKRFPDDEKYGLVVQMRRAAVSIAANLAEGFVKHSIKDKLHFYNSAQGSLEEVRYHLILSRDLQYISTINDTMCRVELTSKMILRFIESIRKSHSNKSS